MDSRDEWMKIDLPFSAGPQETMKPRGRPRKNRIKNLDEKKKHRHKCTRCKEHKPTNLSPIPQEATSHLPYYVPNIKTDPSASHTTGDPSHHKPTNLSPIPQEANSHLPYYVPNTKIDPSEGSGRGTIRGCGRVNRRGRGSVGRSSIFNNMGGARPDQGGSMRDSQSTSMDGEGNIMRRIASYTEDEITKLRNEKISDYVVVYDFEISTTIE
ncbi:hypothetical protein QJS10_CPB12g00645 [Acorus calamus]|uniref:Uncharacterized protein n=1 Tax=Acorus calamus TaxID=4465 RepID=A0AAV9DQ24_ACOCL|nr:hypothetical protein QJS10_CPB12g00645 [Acorus calamus]